ncbi:hypothetical protein FHR32_007703 [Streptosporangium album]|uniref:Uncharacterized protein n=1 Tax=Streptosporangium album TaxID=47479 RepID=A0A7W7WDW8_9ACTN|nr:hypothetical protein [Streptosporangium album]
MLNLDDDQRDYLFGLAGRTSHARAGGPPTTPA